MARLILIFVFLLFGQRSYSELRDKEEAMVFAKKIVETYFAKSCGDYFQMCSDSMRLMTGFGCILINAKPFFKDTLGLCKEFRKQTAFESGYTYDQYLKDYDIRIYSKNEFIDNGGFLAGNGEDSILINGLMISGSQFTENDYLFSGFLLKDGTNLGKPPKNWKGLMKIISKTKDGWRITGMIMH